MNEYNGRTRVVILTENYHIEGDIAHFPDARLTDYIVGSQKFIAVTDADIFRHDDTLVFSTSFLNVQRDQIEIIMPVHEIRSDRQDKSIELMSIQK
ncbi:MAG: hypothetical protein SVY10_06360 [Thermodesulfobacteriota bacterium]|nr:hypothetical protein [Thermodesulfobacteriota bacterium]